LDWSKSEVYANLKEKKIKFEVIDKNGKVSQNIYSENEIILLLRQLKNDKAATFQLENIKGIQKRAF